MQYPKRRRKKSERARLVKSCSIKWSYATKLPTEGRCGLCGSNNQVESHHIVKKGTRMHQGWFLLNNVVPLCWNCHYEGIHSLHFPTTEIYQEKIVEYLKRKGLDYETLFQQCRNGPRMDTEELRRILESLEDFISKF